MTFSIVRSDNDLFFFTATFRNIRMNKTVKVYLLLVIKYEEIVPLNISTRFETILLYTSKVFLKNEKYEIWYILGNILYNVVYLISLGFVSWFKQTLREKISNELGFLHNFYRWMRFLQFTYVAYCCVTLLTFAASDKTPENVQEDSWQLVVIYLRL